MSGRHQGARAASAIMFDIHSVWYVVQLVWPLLPTTYISANDRWLSEILMAIKTWIGQSFAAQIKPLCSNLQIIWKNPKLFGTRRKNATIKNWSEIQKLILCSASEYFEKGSLITFRKRFSDNISKNNVIWYVTSTTRSYLDEICIRNLCFPAPPMTRDRFYCWSFSKSLQLNAEAWKMQNCAF